MRFDACVLLCLPKKKQDPKKLWHLNKKTPHNQRVGNRKGVGTQWSQSRPNCLTEGTHSPRSNGLGDPTDLTTCPSFGSQIFEQLANLNNFEQLNNWTFFWREKKMFCDKTDWNDCVGREPWGGACGRTPVRPAGCTLWWPGPHSHFELASLLRKKTSESNWNKSEKEKN